MKRGQYFTKDRKLQRVVKNLRSNNGSILEPAAGRGHLIKLFETKNHEIDAFEIDEALIKNKVCDSFIANKNFLSYEFDKTYKTIIGNPPYLKRSSIPESDRFNTSNYFSYPKNCNLYFYFIEKSIKLLKDGGELIFIVPKDFFWNSTAENLRRFVYNEGAFSHFIVCEEKSYFDNASLESLIVFRYVKGRKSKELKYFPNVNSYDENHHQSKYLNYFYNSLLYISEEKDQYKDSLRFTDCFSIHVGNVVTGRDSVFKTDKNYNSKYIREVLTTKKIKEDYIFVDNVSDINKLNDSELLDYLKSKKEELKGRGIRQFDEDNWWEWGTLKNVENTRSEQGRIIIYTKTRKDERAWIDYSNCLVSSALMIMVPKAGKVNLNEVEGFINSEKFQDMLDQFQMKTGTKLRLTVKTLKKLPLPVVDSSVSSTPQFSYE